MTDTAHGVSTLHAHASAVRTTRVVRAEWFKLTRFRALAGAGVAIVGIGGGGTALGLALAKHRTRSSSGGGTVTLERLQTADGGTRLFAQTMGYLATFLVATLVAVVAAEFTRGTFRTMLLQEPGRARLFAGKLTAIASFTLGCVAVGEIVSWVVSYAMAPARGVDTSNWVTLAGLSGAVEDLGRSVAYVVVLAVVAGVIGVLARSVPVGVGAALVWFGPVENIVGDSWDPGEQFFPGLLLRAVISPGSTIVSTERALITLACYCAVATVLAAVALGRRDVTS